ncbi:MAG: NB-ARC domain-containing protein [Caldilineaceae bacterium]
METIRVLLLAANPVDNVPLRTGEEFREIDRALRSTQFRDRFEIEQQHATQVGDLVELLLRYRPYIVHFSGHSDIGELYVENRQGESHAVTAAALGSLFAQFSEDVHCVILNACSSILQAQAIAEHIDVVIGMSDAILDSASIQFSIAFYSAIGYGRSIQTAFELGRAQIDLSNLGEYDKPQLIANRIDPALLVVVRTESFTPQTSDPKQLEIGVPLDVALYTEPNVLAAPDKLFGRRELMSQISHTLTQKGKVLLTGMGGIGKSALAAEIANHHLRTNRGQVVWMHCANEKLDTLLEAVAVQAVKSGASITDLELTKTTGDAKIKVVRELLMQSTISLIVLDDIRNGLALRDFQKVLPGHVKLIATSRGHFASLPRIEVVELSADAALDLLQYHATNIGAPQQADAQLLCKLVGYHPFALEIAGKILDVDHKSPAHLLRRLKDSPHTLTSPDFELNEVESRSPSVRTLLDDSYAALDEKAKQLFTAFGTLFAPGATARLLAIYTNQPIDSVEETLEKLAQRSLMRHRANVDYFSLHDLSYSYAKEKYRQVPENAHLIVDAIDRFVLENVQDFDALELEQPNILGAARQAEGEVLLRIVSHLAIGGYPEPGERSYLDSQGHSLEFLERLDRAIDTARSLGPGQNSLLHYLLSKRGNAYDERGEVEKALAAYQEALALAPNVKRQVDLSYVYATMLLLQGNRTEADQLLDQAYELAKQSEDRELLVRVLTQMSYVAGQLEQEYDSARRYAAEAVEISRTLDNQILASALINLGSAEFDVGIAKALQAHQEALELSNIWNDDSLEATARYAIGVDYHALREFDKAYRYLIQARELFHKLGNTSVETEIATLLRNYATSKP